MGIEPEARKGLRNLLDIIPGDYGGEIEVQRKKQGCPTTASRPTPRSTVALRDKLIGGAAYAERWADIGEVEEDWRDE